MTDPTQTLNAQFSGRLGTFALDVAFEVPARGITALFGPSGCGKTTVLRCVAGLNRMPGRLSIAGDVWQDDKAGICLKPHERAVGYVFQEASLFAHLSVDANLRYGLRRALHKGSSQSFGFDDVVDLLGLKHLLYRSTDELSGGERQRVAVGRALLAQPRLFLMDEPLSALDRMTKEEILPYFEALRTSFSIPVLYVSHDISEVERLADHIVLLDAGRVVASGPLAEILVHPALPVAQGREASSVLTVRVGRYSADDGLTELEIGDQKLLVPGHVGREGADDRIRIAATDVSLSVERPSQTTILNVLAARVLDMQPVNEAQLNVLLSIGHRQDGPKLLARVTRRAQRLLDFRPGQDLYAQVKAASLVRRPL